MKKKTNKIKQANAHKTGLAYLFAGGTPTAIGESADGLLQQPTPNPPALDLDEMERLYDGLIEAKNREVFYGTRPWA